MTRGLSSCVALGSVLVLLSAPSAQARWGNGHCSLESHCYAITQWAMVSPEKVKGAEDVPTTNNFNVPEWTAGFVDDEMWLIFSNLESGWLEIGQTAGNRRALPTPQQAKAQSTAPLAAAAARRTIALSTATGVVTGRLTISGGPAPGRPRPWPHGLVALIRGSHVMARAETSSKGTFKLFAFPGRYKISGRGALCTAQTVSLKPGRTTNVALHCSIK